MDPTPARGIINIGCKKFRTVSKSQGDRPFLFIPDNSPQLAVKLNVYNIRGQLVKILVDDSQSPGTYNINWDGTDTEGRKISSGVYFYRLLAGEFVSTRKMVVLK